MAEYTSPLTEMTSALEDSEAKFTAQLSAAQPRHSTAIGSCTAPVLSRAALDRMAEEVEHIKVQRLGARRAALAAIHAQVCRMIDDLRFIK